MQTPLIHTDPYVYFMGDSWNDKFYFQVLYTRFMPARNGQRIITIETFVEILQPSPHAKKKK